MATSIKIPMRYTVDLDAPIGVQSLRQPLVMQNKAAHKFIIHAVRSGADADLTGVGVDGYLIRSDKTTVVMTGSIESKDATLTLPLAAYAIPGRCQLVINLTTTDTTQTVLALDFTILRSTTETHIDPGHVVPDITELLAQIAAMRSATQAATQAAERAEAAVAEIPALIAAETADIRHDLSEIAVDVDPNVITTETEREHGYLDNNGAFVPADPSLQWTTVFTACERGVAYVIDIRYFYQQIRTEARAVYVYNEDKTPSRRVEPAEYKAGFVLTGTERFVRINWNGYMNDQYVDNPHVNMYPLAEGKETYKEIIAKIPERRTIDTAYIHARRPLIAFMLDGNYDLNPDIVAVFDRHGHKLGLAPEYNSAWGVNYRQPLSFYLDCAKSGHDILVHGAVDVSATSPYTPEQCRQYIKDSFVTMRGYGFDANGYIALAGKFNQAYADTLQQFYEFGATVANHSATYQTDALRESCLYFEKDHPYKLWRYSMQLSSPDECKAAVDRAIATGGLLLFYGHARSREAGFTDNTYLYPSNVDTLLTYIEKKDIEIKTPTEAIKDYYSIRYDDIIK